MSGYSMRMLVQGTSREEAIQAADNAIETLFSDGHLREGDRGYVDATEYPDRESEVRSAKEDPTKFVARLRDLNNDRAEVVRGLFKWAHEWARKAGVERLEDLKTEELMGSEAGWRASNCTTQARWSRGTGRPEASSTTPTPTRRACPRNASRRSRRSPTSGGSSRRRSADRPFSGGDLPYTTQWVEPELALEHKDVKVYYTYRDDDWDQGRLAFWFITDPEKGSEDKEAFDVRGLPTWQEPIHPPYLTGLDDTPENRTAWERYNADRVEEKAMLAVLREAIDRGLLPKPRE